MSDWLSIDGKPITTPPDGGPTEAEAFTTGLLSHIQAGYDAQRATLRTRWEFAVWFRPFVQHGGDRRSADFKPERVPSWSPRSVFEEMREAGMIRLQWSSLLRYLPLADYGWDTLRAEAHTVRGGLKWCAEQNQTPAEQLEAKRQRQERKAASDTRTQRDRLIIRDLSGEVSRLKALVDADLVEVVAGLRRELAEVKADNTAKRRRIEYLQLQAAHRRLSDGRGSLKGSKATAAQWCKKCANPPGSCECDSVPEVAANGNGASKYDLFAHATVSPPGEC